MDKLKTLLKKHPKAVTTITTAATSIMILIGVEPEMAASISKVAAPLIGILI